MFQKHSFSIHSLEVQLDQTASILSKCHAGTPKQYCAKSKGAMLSHGRVEE